MFYANPSIKKALIGYRGAWAAFGIEFNFPVSHNWMSMSPVDFATGAERRRQRIDLGRQHRPRLRHAWRVRADAAARVARCSSRTSTLYNRERRAAPVLLVDERRPCRSATIRGWSTRRSFMATHGFTASIPGR